MNSDASNPIDMMAVLMREHEDVLARRSLLDESIAKVVPPGDASNLAAYYEAAHAVKPSALCLSGGGIRSAAFGLGVLQGLARFRVLHRFDYLSTVSGGGYIGGWLT